MEKFQGADGVKFRTGKTVSLRAAGTFRRSNSVCTGPFGWYIAGMKTTMADLEVITRKGKPVSVIVPIKDYEELLERAEDADDVAWLKNARRKPLLYRPLEDYLAAHHRK